MSYNKQPVFASTPILYVQTFDPLILSGSWNSGSISPTEVYYNSDEKYTIIDRVTVSSTGDITNNSVSDKLVYLLIKDYGTGYWGVYKVGHLPAVTISTTQPNSEIVWTFDGGLKLGPTYDLGGSGYKLGIMASTNYVNTNSRGDYLSVTVEGSIYN